MTTNEIEKQLRARSVREMSDLAEEITNNIREFTRKSTSQNKSGMSWYHKSVKPHAKYEGQTVDDPWNHLDWHQLSTLIFRNLQENLLTAMVEKKSKELLSKIDLLG